MVQAPAAAQASTDAELELAALIADFRQVAIASVSDAVDRVAGVGQAGFMSHEMKPRTLPDAKIAGPAVTVLEGPSELSAPPAHALDVIDTAPPGSVIVIGMEDPAASRDVAIWGGIMTAGAQARRLEAAVLDAGARDIREVREAGFPVFSRTVVPSTTVGRFVTRAANVPVRCGGVLVHPGDIVVGDPDGVVVVPRAYAAEVLRIAQEIDRVEAGTAEMIHQVGSVREGVAKFNRI